MISVADLIQGDRVPGNYFDYPSYVRGELEMGLLENRRGDRLLAVPDTLVAALYEALAKETGQASRLVLFNCGKWWGKSFYNRFTEWLTEYYGMPVAEMEMQLFGLCLQECWRTHGWGRFELDTTHQERGFLVVKTRNSPYAKPLPKMNQPSCYLEAGVLASFFSRLAGRELTAVQIACESMGADRNEFVLGLPERLKPASAGVEEGLDREAIWSRLLG
jgi:predicted hydrocarbon binding protein